MREDDDPFGQEADRRGRSLRASGSGVGCQATAAPSSQAMIRSMDRSASGESPALSITARVANGEPGVERQVGFGHQGYLTGEDGRRRKGKG